MMRAMLMFVLSTYIMWKSIQHNDVHGPKSAKYRDEASKESLEGTNMEAATN